MTASDLFSRLETSLPILQVILPMLTAPICIILRRARLAWGVAMVVTWGALGVSITLLQKALATGVISYAVGGWAPPWGIELRIGVLNAFVLVLVTSVSAVVLTSAPKSLGREVPEDRHYLFYAAFLLCMTGLLGIASAGDAFNIFVFLEISSLSAYALVAQGTSRRALSAAFQYLIMGTIGGTFLLLGIGLLYMVTGTLNLVDMAARLGASEANRTVLVALACITVGTGIKLALFPLHSWLPNAYTYAPATVSAFLAATATKVAYYVLLTFVFRVFGAELAIGRLRLDLALLPLAVLAMLVASTVAIFERDVKRMLAYSSLAQIGYMVLGLAMATPQSLTGGIVHLMNHALTKSGLFLALAAVVLRIGSCRLEDMKGLGRRMPWTSSAFVVGGLSLIGVPATAGFVSKWYLVSAALADGRHVLAFLVLFSSLLAVIYVGRVVEVLYFEKRDEGAPDVREAPLALLLPTWTLAGATLYFGLFTEATAHVAEVAGRLLMEGGL